MRTILFILRKEFLQIFRNRSMLPIIFVMPLIQLLLLANAATFEVKNAKFVWIDEDGSTLSHQIAERLQASGYFKLTMHTFSEQQALESLLRGDANLVLHVKPGFEEILLQDQPAPVLLILDAVDGATAGVIQSYVTTVLADLNRDIRLDVTTPISSSTSRVEVVPAYWYNPALNYKFYMVPGILVLLVTIIGLFLSAMNVVREKEIGTIEQLNVTPIRKYQFITGKLVPFWIIALIEMAIGLLIARLIFNVPLLGSPILIFLLTAVYLGVVLGIGLWISTVTETQQQAMFIAWFVMVIFILMSGLFTPIQSMPSWAQTLTRLNPVAYIIEMLRRVMLKGAGFDAVKHSFLVLAAYGAIMLGLAVRQYRKVTD